MEEMKVCIFKLINGEELVAKVASQNTAEYILKDARILFSTQSGELKLAPTMFSHDLSQTVTLYKSAIASFSDTPKADFEQAYKEAVSPLAMPDRKIVLG